MKTPHDIKSAFLENCVKDFKVFIDTCSLLEESSDKFFQNVVPILEREKKALIVGEKPRLLQREISQ